MTSMEMPQLGRLTRASEVAGAYQSLGIGTQRTHAVQFYEDESFFASSVGDFLATGLAIGQKVLAVTTAPHREALRAHLVERGFDVDRAMLHGQLTLADADELLAKFMVGGMPDARQCRAAITKVLRAVGSAPGYGAVRVFGEMVDVLCRAGNVAGAIRLEALWNELARAEHFSLLCAYAMTNFRDGGDTASVAAICGEHLHVIPTERYMQATPEGRSREIALLQQRAQALEREVERSRELEHSLREALARAEAANRAKGEFLAMMSHELRTPLNAIGGHVQLMEMELHGPVTDRQREALSRVQRSQRYLLALINDVLNLARAESAELRYVTQVVALGPLVTEVLELLAPLFESGALGYGVTVEEHPEPTARADREKVHQILLNLLGNAVKFTPAGGRISVRVRSHDTAGLLAVDVEDDGIGIPPDKLESVFQPFVQLASLDFAPRQGIGLGLSISRTLARGMGGDLIAANAPSGGSILTLTLPRS
jgi:signal transduction histidine kinase